MSTKTGSARPATSDASIDAVLNRLGAARSSWTGTSLADRCRLIDRCIDGVIEVSDRWVAEACNRKRIDTEGAAAGDEWMSGPAATVRGLRLYRESLEADAQPATAEPHLSSTGRTVVPIFPRSAMDGVLYFGLDAEIWIQPGKQASQGRIYRENGADSEGGIGLVLGAGNIASIAPLDVFHKLFVENEVVVLKMNPVNDYLGPFLETALAPLIEAGFLGVVYGGAEQGAKLCGDSRVESIHLTGSHRTHDAIVWGSDPAEQQLRKSKGDPLLRKRITSELGCVTPILACPGSWTDNELDYQAQQVASMVTNNASFNCNAGKVLVLADGWNQKREFLDRLRLALKLSPPRYAYYPGAEERYRRYLERYPQAEVLGATGDGVVPWTLIPSVPAQPDEYALHEEAFCGILAQVDLPAGDADEFFDAAIPFANDSVWGTLSCGLLIDDRSAETHRDRLEQAIADLRYGGIAINAWPGVNYYLGQASWGAYPGHTLEDVRSGIGWVHNSLMFDFPEKTVVRAPFRIWPKPLWFNDHRSAAAMARSLTRYEAYQSRAELLKLAPNALLG